MGFPPLPPFQSLQAAALRSLELAALRQTVLSAVPACQPVSLACPPANISCPVAVFPPPICPPPVVNLSWPPQEGGSVIVGERRVVEAGVCGGVLGVFAGAAATGLVARQGDFILIRYDLPGAPLFHERLVTGVSQSVPGLLATLTADGDHYAEETRSDDVAEVRWSGVQGATSAGVDARQVYRFRAMPSDAELEQLRRDGALLVGGPPPAAPGPLVPAGGAAAPAAAPAPAAGQGGEAGVVGRAGAAPPIAAAAPAVWLATEGFRGRGERLPDPLPPNAEVHGDVALGPVQGGWVTAPLVPAAEIDAFVIDDFRVLPVKFSQEGARRRSFTEAVYLQVADEPEGGLMSDGPSSCLWVLRSWRDAGLTPVTHRANWLRAGRIPDGDRSIHEHEVLCRVLESMISVDQLNAPALQSAELVCRRLQVIEDARAVSPSAPDYSAADEYMGWSAHRGGSAVAPALQKHVAANLRDKAAVLKGARKAKEEQKLRRGPTGAAKGDPAHNGGSGQWPPRAAGAGRPAAARRTTAAFSRRGAAKELLATSLSCTGDEAPSPAVKYVRSRVDIPEVDAAVSAVETVLDPIGRGYVLDYESKMMLTPDEWSRVLDSEPPVTPYMDEVLKSDPGAYHLFISDQVKANMLGFTFRSQDLVTPFFVTKKSGAQRLVWDARVPNRVLTDHGPALCLLPYCDNINVIGTDPDRCNVQLNAICAEWRRRGVLIHEVVEAADTFTSLGRFVDGVSGLVCAGPERAERLRQAALWLEQRPRVTGREVEKFIGHLIDHAMLRRELLCILRNLYDVVRDCYSRTSSTTPWELNPDFIEVPAEALQDYDWKQVVSARVRVRESITIVEGRAANMTSRHDFRKGFLKGRPLVGATRAERSAKRQESSGPFRILDEGDKGFLEWNAVAPRTQAYYEEALTGFSRFASSHGLAPVTSADADLALTNYADYAWSIGLERADLLVGLMIVVMFWAYLRPSEVGLADESILLDSVEVPWLGPLVAGCLTCNPAAMLFRAGAQELGRLWRRALVFRLCRRGSLAEINDRGRWASDYSIKRCEAHALAQQELTELGAVYAALSTRPFLELMCGSARLASAVAAAGWAAQGWDREDGEAADLSDPAVIARLERSILDHEVEGGAYTVDFECQNEEGREPGHGVCVQLGLARGTIVQDTAWWSFLSPTVRIPSTGAAEWAGPPGKLTQVLFGKLQFDPARARLLRMRLRSKAAAKISSRAHTR
ncbi:unnamed protein product, partial [Prorocentrum cordatum]